jgi:hypothetical protein
VVFRAQRLLFLFRRFLRKSRFYLVKNRRELARDEDYRVEIGSIRDTSVIEQPMICRECAQR